MKSIKKILTLFFALNISLSTSATIISGYRIKINSMGTVYLLGDEHRRNENDAQQFQSLSTFLKETVKKYPTLINIETTSEDQEYFKAEQAKMLTRLPETQVLTKLRITLANLKSVPELKNITFTASDPRTSNVWDIVTNSGNSLKKLMPDILGRKKITDKTYTIGSLIKDKDDILARYERFKKRIQKIENKQLSHRIIKELEHKVSTVKQAWEEIEVFFKKYSGIKEDNTLEKTSIQTIIYNWLVEKYGKAYIEKKLKNKEETIAFFAKNFYNFIKPLFREQFYLPLVNLPWFMDIFNSFVFFKKDHAVFYAGASHINQMVQFLKKIQKADPSKSIVFESEIDRNKSLNDKELKTILKIPLSKKELQTEELKQKIRIREQARIKKLEREIRIRELEAQIKEKEKKCKEEADNQHTNKDLS